MLEAILNFLRHFSLVGAAFNVFKKDVKTKVSSLPIDESVTDSFVILRKNNNKAEAYLVKVFVEGRKTQTNLNESIDLELLPKEYEEELRNNNMCRFIL